MGTFRRTISGLNNQHLFFDVDYIIYVEGGNRSYSKDEIYNGRFNDDTEDIHFWRKIFSLTKPNIKYKFKSVGSKKTLKDIAEDLIHGSIDRIYLAMDSEFDGIFNKKIIHPHIFYTNGYSYENDIWSDQLIISILEDLTAAEINKEFVTKGYNKFLKNIKLAVFADGYLFNKNSSFFPRKQGHLFCIECQVENFPEVKAEVIQQLILQKNLNSNTIKAFGYRKKIDSKVSCFGHLLADYCCQIINYYIKKFHSLNTIRKELIYRIAIKKFFDKHYQNSITETYYSQLITS